MTSLQESRLRIAVGGLAVTFPFGGIFWHYLQFVLGLQRLGHEVLYVEDVGRWCYHPIKRTYVKDGASNARRFEANVAALSEKIDWHFRDAAETCFGWTAAAAADYCRAADLFINLSMSHDVKGAYSAAECTVLVDTDPLYTQALLAPRPHDAIEDKDIRVLEMIDSHDVFFTFGLNVGADDCLVPTGGKRWNPTVQPVVLDLFADARTPVSQRRNVFTTIASWEPHEATTRVGDQLYYGKSREFERVMDLPARAAAPLELALSGEPPIETLNRHGWHVIDGYPVTMDPWKFQTYCAHSLGEFTVAKHAYVASRSGWFSDRSAAYLALGVPVVLQDTGFGRKLPVGEGLLDFSDVDSAAAAIEAVVTAPERHAQAALEIAEQHFSAERVMQSLLDVVHANV